MNFSITVNQRIDYYSSSSILANIFLENSAISGKIKSIKLLKIRIYNCEIIIPFIV